MKGPSHSVIQGGGMDLGGQSGGELKGASSVCIARAMLLLSCCVFGSSMYDKMLWPVLATAGFHNKLRQAGCWNLQGLRHVLPETSRW